jgi:hypothetical protein
MQGGSPPSSQAAQGNQRRSLASGPYPGPVHGAVTLSNVPYNIYGGGPQAASSSTFSKESDMDADSPNEEDEAVEAMPPFYTKFVIFPESYKSSYYRGKAACFQACQNYYRVLEATTAYVHDGWCTLWWFFFFLNDHDCTIIIASKQFFDSL